MTYPSTVKYLLIGVETSWGTGGTANKDIGLVITDVGNPAEREVISSEGISNRAAQHIDAGIMGGGVTVAGDFQHARGLIFVFGTVASVETTSDWKHTFTMSDTPPSARIETGNNLTTDSTIDTPGCIFESGELSINLNENLKLSLTFKGKTPAEGASAGNEVISTLPVFPAQEVTVKLNQVAATEFQSASISFEGTVVRSAGIGGTGYVQGHSTLLKFKYKAVLGFQANTQIALFTADTVHEFEIVADNGVALGSGQRNLTLTLQNCRQSTFNEVTTVGGLTFLEVAGEGTLKECFSVDNITDTAFPDSS